MNTSELEALQRIEALLIEIRTALVSIGAPLLAEIREQAGQRAHVKLLARREADPRHFRDPA